MLFQIETILFPKHSIVYYSAMDFKIQQNLVAEILL
jgi:hypothetical protein